MSEIDLKDYVAGGYFVAKYTTEGFWRSPLLPERVVSLSSCIGKQLDVVLGWNVDQYKKEILEFGIRADKLESFKDWCGGQTPGGISQLETARYVINEFISTSDGLLLLGAALRHELLENFIHQVPTFAVDKAHSIDADGTPLGFEVISHFASHLSCSWLCSGLEKDMNELFGIQPNQYGLIDSYADAKQVYEWIAEDKMQGTRAEPLPYYPWLIVQYPVN
jgi:hypothetical protein